MGQLDFGLIATAVIGTRMKPRPSTALAHSATRSIDAGSAEATPTALPCSRASASSLVSARSISCGRRHRVEHDLGLGERQVVGAGDLTGEAARRRAVVDVDQSAPRRFLEHRRQGLLVRGEARAHVVGDADITLEAAHQPIKAVEVLFHAERGQQGLRAGIVVRIVERLHRCLQQHLVSVGTGIGRQTVDVGAVGRERESHGPGNFSIACRVMAALTPRPPITMAIFGPSLRPSSALGRA